MSRRCCRRKNGSNPCARDTGGIPFSGYEMHMGVTAGPDCARPFARLSMVRRRRPYRPTGALIGTYIHGLFGNDFPTRRLAARLGAGPSAIAHDALVESTLDRLAAHIAAHIDVEVYLNLRDEKHDDDREEPDQQGVGAPDKGQRCCGYRRP